MNGNNNGGGMQDLMLERLDQSINRRKEEIDELEELVKTKKRELQELLFIRGGSERGAEEAVFMTRAGKVRNGGKIEGWTDAEDAIIISVIEKAGKIGVGEASRETQPKLPHRTAGAINQRIRALMAKGILKRKDSANGPMMVEMGRRSRAEAA